LGFSRGRYSKAEEVLQCHQRDWVGERELIMGDSEKHKAIILHPKVPTLTPVPLGLPRLVGS
jgi:hypothetical protein